MTAPTSKVYFVRHGQSEWNKLNLFCGWNDVDLSEEGKWDALDVSATALRTENAKIDVIYCSALKRTIQTVDLIVNELNLSAPIYQSWRLNERHYGALTGFNKRQMADLYGEQQVQVWRRSFNVAPPAITPLNPFYEAIRSNMRLRKIDSADFPDTETLETTMERVIPYWHEMIVPKIRLGKRILIVAHGTSLRGLVKHIEGKTTEEIMKFNLPNSIPFVYEFDENIKAIRKIRFLASDDIVQKAVKQVAAIGR